jgi:hypothetical protein
MRVRRIVLRTLAVAAFGAASLLVSKPAGAAPLYCGVEECGSTCGEGTNLCGSGCYQTACWDTGCIDQLTFDYYEFDVYCEGAS